MIDLFTDDFRVEPYWWSASPSMRSPGEQAPGAASTTPPGDVDVAIVGAGYTGLHAAIQTARAGLSTVVFEAGLAGRGCSTRNGGQISTSIKPSRTTLVRRYGERLADALIADGRASRAHVERFVREESIDCDFRVAGRFHGAHSIGAWQRLVFEHGGRQGYRAKHSPSLEWTEDAAEAYLVPRSEQASEIGSDVYHGGVVYPNHASLDPARYHAGCLRVARDTGAVVVEHCPVQRIERLQVGSRLHTSSGSTRAGKVLIATNGHTGSLTPWLRRRVIPIGSSIVASEAIEPSLLNRCLPTDRVLSDTRQLVYYYRPSPDRRSILFGGRVSLTDARPEQSAVKLQAELCRLFPDLRGVRIARAWAGTVAFTFDSLMHAGEHDGLHYALGYCGSGVGMSGYLGMRMGRRMAGLDLEPLSFEQIDFPTRASYRGRPWFLAPSILWYRLRDRMS